MKWVENVVKGRIFATCEMMVASNDLSRDDEICNFSRVVLRCFERIFRLEKSSFQNLLKTFKDVEISKKGFYEFFDEAQLSTTRWETCAQSKYQRSLLDSDPVNERKNVNVDKETPQIYTKTYWHLNYFWMFILTKSNFQINFEVFSCW